MFVCKNPLLTLFDSFQKSKMAAMTKINGTPKYCRDIYIIFHFPDDFHCGTYVCENLLKQLVSC